MTIRQYAKQNKHEVIGKLKRVSDETCIIKGKEHTFRMYVDEAGNEYQVDWKGNCVCISGETEDGCFVI